MNFRMPFCMNCEKSGHSIEDCWDLNDINPKRSTCKFCKKTGHRVDECFKLKTLKQFPNDDTSSQYKKVSDKLSILINKIRQLKSIIQQQRNEINDLKLKAHSTNEIMNTDDAFDELCREIDSVHNDMNSA